MSQENVEVVKRMLDAFDAGDFELARALTAERLSTRDSANYNWAQRSRALRGLGHGQAAIAASAQAEINRMRFAAALAS